MKNWLVHVFIITFFLLPISLLSQRGVDFCNLSSGNYCSELEDYIEIYQKEYDQNSKDRRVSNIPSFIRGLKKLRQHFEKGKLTGGNLEIVKKHAINLRKIKVYQDSRLKSILKNVIHIVDEELKSIIDKLSK